VRVRVYLVVLLTALAAAAGAAPAGAEPVSGTALRFQSGRPGEIIVPVFVGGRGPYRFLLDTGSTHTAIRQSLVVTLGATPVARASMATSTGSIECIVVRLTEVAIGAVRVTALLATALPSSVGAVLGSGIDGVIGQDFLSQFDYTIDYGNARLVWNDNVERRPGVRLLLVPSQGRFLVELPQTDDVKGTTVHFVPDSGADGMLLFETGTSHLRIDPQSSSRQLESLAGQRAARSVVLRNLQVGGVRLREQPALLMSEHPAGGGVSGLLPLHLFASVSFNNHDGYMLVRAR